MKVVPVETMSRTAAKVLTCFYRTGQDPSCETCTGVGLPCGNDIADCCDGGLTCFNSFCLPCTEEGATCGDDSADCCEGSTCFNSLCTACTEEDIHATKMRVSGALKMVMNVEIANRTAVKVLSATHLLQGTRFVRSAVVKTIPVETILRTAAKVLPATMVRVRAAFL
eukprot:404361_1